jgi:hypothetical protein
MPVVLQGPFYGVPIAGTHAFPGVYILGQTRNFVGQGDRFIPYYVGMATQIGTVGDRVINHFNNHQFTKCYPIFDIEPAIGLHNCNDLTDLYRQIALWHPNPHNVVLLPGLNRLLWHNYNGYFTAKFGAASLYVDRTGINRSLLVDAPRWAVHLDLGRLNIARANFQRYFTYFVGDTSLIAATPAQVEGALQFLLNSFGYFPYSKPKHIRGCSLAPKPIIKPVYPINFDLTALNAVLPNCLHGLHPIPNILPVYR